MLVFALFRRFIYRRKPKTNPADYNPGLFALEYHNIWICRNHVKNSFQIYSERLSGNFGSFVFIEIRIRILPTSVLQKYLNINVQILYILKVFKIPNNRFFLCEPGHTRVKELKLCELILTVLNLNCINIIFSLTDICWCIFNK